ncbi:MAG: Mor transcription activator family protein [Burkholderiaceae bacterium]
MNAHVKFPDGYPEILEQMGYVIARRLADHGVPVEQLQDLTLGITEEIRFEVGGRDTYIPKGHLFELSQRDEEIYNQFKGNNYYELARKYGLTEIQIRSIVKRGRERDLGKRQGSLI